MDAHNELRWLRLAGLVWLLGLGLALAVPTSSLRAQPDTMPEVEEPFAGDPRLEPLPAGPVNLSTFPAVAGSTPITIATPPRVNGQTQSDGDQHADLFVLFDAATGDLVAQPPVIEAVPVGAAPAVGDEEARLASAIWQFHAVTVDPAYDPLDPGQLIDSVSEVGSSPWVTEVFQTNIFVNAPVLPGGSTVGPTLPMPMTALRDGASVRLVPFEVWDGPPQPQIMFKFEDADGNVIGAPLLLATHPPGTPFYSAIWELWTVTLPGGLLTSSGIRLNAPVVAVDGTPVPAEDPIAFLTDSTGRFDPAKFPFDVPSGEFTKSRSFYITQVWSGGAAVRESVSAMTSDFPPIDPDGKGNVIPLILQDPWQLLSSGPNSAGPIVRFSQPELDDAFLNNDPPELPPALEANFSALISAGLLDPQWAPGGRPYQDRLAAVGRALFELVWQPEQGANPDDVTNCLACHGLPAAGGASRGLFSFENPAGEAVSNAGSMFGGGAAELLNEQLRAGGATDLTFAHGSQGSIASLRLVTANAPNNHFGIQSAEFVGIRTVPGVGWDATTDLDGDGVVNEKSVGEVTAESAFLLTLPVPDTASPSALAALDVDPAAVGAGRSLFRRSIDAGGIGCGSCHTVFHPLTSNELSLGNPRTAVEIPLAMTHHSADQADVDDGLATAVGEMGLRIYGDFRLHKMGPDLAVSGSDTRKTAELWDVGSVAPYPSSGATGSDLAAVVLAHGGRDLTGFPEVFRSDQFDFPFGSSLLSLQLVIFQNLTGAPIPATPAEPVRLVLTGPITPGAFAFADGAAPGGGLRHGAFWTIEEPIAASATVNVVVFFLNTAQLPLEYDLTAQDHVGFSEAVAVTKAYEALSPADRDDVIDFLRAQLIEDTPAEGMK